MAGWADPQIRRCVTGFTGFEAPIVILCVPLFDIVRRWDRIMYLPEHLK